MAGRYSSSQHEAVFKKDMPPYIELAHLCGAVILRRGIEGIWAGTALDKLKYAKQGLLIKNPEMFAWRTVKSSCYLCGAGNTLTVQYEGPGTLRPQALKPRSREMESMGHAPVKVMDALICPECRIKVLPRCIIFTQWTLCELTSGPTTCKCEWDGEKVCECRVCMKMIGEGKLRNLKPAQGWEVRRFFDPLEELSAERWGGVLPQANPLTEEGPSMEDLEDCESGQSLEMFPMRVGPAEVRPSAPICPQLKEKATRLEEAISSCWPLERNFSENQSPPVGSTHHQMGFRVYRDPEEGGYTNGLDRLTDEQRPRAVRGGWLGPWEITDWTTLIIEVLRDPKIDVTPLRVSREPGVSTSHLRYISTTIDGWGSCGLGGLGKTKRYIVTPEDWRRGGLVQRKGTMAGRTAHPWRPQEHLEVELSIQMVVIPLKSIQSVGATLRVVRSVPPGTCTEKVIPLEPPLTPPFSCTQRWRRWLRMKVPRRN